MKLLCILLMAPSMLSAGAGAGAGAQKPSTAATITTKNSIIKQIRPLNGKRKLYVVPPKSNSPKTSNISDGVTPTSEKQPDLDGVALKLPKNAIKKDGDHSPHRTTFTFEIATPNNEPQAEQQTAQPAPTSPQAQSCWSCRRNNKVHPQTKKVE